MLEGKLPHCHLCNADFLIYLSCTLPNYLTCFIFEQCSPNGSDNIYGLCVEGFTFSDFINSFRHFSSSRAIFAILVTLPRESSSSCPASGGNAAMEFLIKSTNVTWFYSRASISCSFSARRVMHPRSSYSFSFNMDLRNFALLYYLAA